MVVEKIMHIEVLILCFQNPECGAEHSFAVAHIRSIKHAVLVFLDELRYESRDGSELGKPGRDVAIQIRITFQNLPQARQVIFTMSSTCCGGTGPWQCTSITGYFAFLTSVLRTL